MLSLSLPSCLIQLDPIYVPGKEVHAVFPDDCLCDRALCEFQCDRREGTQLRSAAPLRTEDDGEET